MRHVNMILALGGAFILYPFDLIIGIKRQKTQFDRFTCTIRSLELIIRQASKEHDFAVSEDLMQQLRDVL